MKVFLLADIGNSPNETYHIGDEAMFLKNLKYYNSLKIDVSASSRSISHQNLNFNECLDIYITNIPMLVYLTISAYLLRYLKINFFPSFFHKTIKQLTTSDLLHISGAGNLNSLWPGHIYYRYLMITIANIFNIETILTGQTIGPNLNLFDKYLLQSCLKKTNYIGVRDKHYSINTLNKLEIDRKKIKISLDDAYFLKPSNFLIKKWITKNTNKKNKIKIGLSIHNWNNINEIKKLNKLLIKLNNSLSNIYFFVIPHVLNNKNQSDYKFMKKIILKNIKNVEYYNFQYIKSESSKAKITMAETIKTITSLMDVMITSRYHGLVFSLSSNIPCLSINYDEYYSVKNNGLLDFIFNKKNPYTISIKNINKFLPKINNLITKRKEIANLIKIKNKKLAKKYEIGINQDNTKK